MISEEKRKEMETLIYDFFDAMDKSGTNTKKYKEMFSSMTDSEFDKFFKDFFKDEDAYLTLDIVDYEHTVDMNELEKGSKVLGVPLYERVSMPHVTMDKKKVVSTPYPVPVGYVHIKRTQQTVAKKNGISTNIDARSALTAQVTGADKNGRESDLENSMLTISGFKEVLRELNGPRSDDMVMKNEMYRDIALNGYTSLNTLTDNVENKTTLNTVNVFLLGMGINSDLVTSGLMLKNTIKSELK